MDATKSYDIAPEAVKDAWARVKSNKGSAGIDEETIEQFENRLEGNLYKIWNTWNTNSK